MTVVSGPGPQLRPATDLVLLRAFEPVVRLTQGEFFLPVGVDAYVRNSALFEQLPDGSTALVAGTGELDLDRLAQLGRAVDGPGQSLSGITVSSSRWARVRGGWKRTRKPAFRGSADPTFRGDPALCNPEDLLVVALSSCHMLSYLAECALAGIAVVAYEDAAAGTMAMADGRVRFTEVVLRPRVIVAAGADLARAEALHQNAHDVCFIASSVNFPVRHEATVTRAAG